MTFRTIASALSRAASDLQIAMCKLNEMQFSAPWKPEARR